MKPNIYTYENYREFLHDLVEHLRSTRRAFSTRYFARLAGLSSPGYLKQVIDSEKNLTPSSIQKFAKGFKLNQHETEFFENLVYFNQAKSAEEKNHFYKRMTKSRRYRECKGIEQDQFQYFSHWYYPAVRELVTFDTFQEDPDWISQQLDPSISAKEAKEALDLLLRLRLIQRRKDGTLQQVDPAITTGAEIGSLAAKNFHREMSKKAVESLERTSSKKRDISGMTLGVPSKKLPEIKQRIDEFRNELSAMIETYSEAADSVYHLNIQMFPLTKKEKGSDQNENS